MTRPLVSRVPHKWRPRMALVVTLVCASLLAVPSVAIFALQLGTNWFMRETESALLKQAAIYAGAYAQAFEATKTEGDTATPGYYLPPPMRVFWNAEARTFNSLLDLRVNTIEPTRPDAVESDKTLGPRYRQIADGLKTLAERAGRTTLSSVVFVDYQGLDLQAATPMSFASVPEVEKALRGEVGAALRWRSDADARWPFLSVSRGTGFRVLITYPVISANRVIGAVYISRTPRPLENYSSQEATAFLTLAAVTVLGALIIGSFLVWAVLRPLLALRNQARRVANGDDTDLAPLGHYGIAEIAQLGDALLTMAGSLSQRSKEITIYTNHVTHELKSPVTSIVGAAELLEGGDLPPETQRALAATIREQGDRMTRLLDQLREITRARQHVLGQSSHVPTRLSQMLPAEDGVEISVNDGQATLPLSLLHGRTVLSHMAQNARHHGADRLLLHWHGRQLIISDNGRGFADVDLTRLGQPFFTTRREEGGTGLGLAIVIAILDLYGATLRPVRHEEGARFEIDFSGD